MKIEDTVALVTIRDWVRWGISRFNEASLWYGHGTDNAFDESLALVLFALHLDHELPPDFLDSRVTPSEGERVFEFLRRRVEERVPAAYITGEMLFAGLPFVVNENVLVPRSPIAELIEQGFSPWLHDEEGIRILDLCTGSGCIAMACAHHMPESMVDAVDISPLALEVAEVNLQRLRLEDQVNLIQSDLFEAVPPVQYDLIVSNPPYVSYEEMESLPQEYRNEPALALEAGDDGMDIVAKILQQGGRFLKPGGIMVVEVGNSMSYLMDRYPEVPFLWLDFERGGDGIFLLTADQLDEYQEIFDERLEA